MHIEDSTSPKGTRETEERVRRVLLERSSSVAFGNYQLIGRLATGGMAEVFLARDLEAQCEAQLEGQLEEQGQIEEQGQGLLVIKKMLSHLENDPVFVSMFESEGMVGKQLSHPNLCTIFEHGTVRQESVLGATREIHFIAMEWVFGIPLGQWLRLSKEGDSQLPRMLALHIARELARTLQYVHQAKDQSGEWLEIVHRDVSPQNIVLSFSGDVKLLDFGVAHTRHERMRLEKSFASKGKSEDVSLVKGKFGYMAPEQCLGAKIDRRADLFALGIVLYEMLTGTNPFRRHNEQETMRAIVNEDFEPLRDISPSLVQVLARLLAKKPTDRFSDASELEDALNKTIAEAKAAAENETEHEWRDRLRRELHRHFPGEAQDGPPLHKVQLNSLPPIAHEGVETGSSITKWDASS